MTPTSIDQVDTRAPVLEGRKLTKTYGGVTVVDQVSIGVQAGEVCAVIGENGAGKSTLMNMLTGVVCQDGGEIRVNSVPLELTSPRDAADAGIAIVHQELQLVSVQSVADNLILIRPPGARGMRRGSRAEHAYVRSVIRQVGLEVEPGARVSTLSLPQCQMLEIAKALALEAKVIVFDEPTAGLPPSDSERLLVLIEALRGQGRAIIYISHALDEVLRIADRICVLRDGRLVGEFEGGQVDRDTLIRAMVDRPVSLYTQRRLPPVREEVVLAAENIRTASVCDLNLELHAGEIVGFAGLIGGGMNEAGLALCGAAAILAGTLRLDGQVRHFRSPHQAAVAGITLVPEERKRDGIIPRISVCENLHVGRHRLHRRGVFLSPKRLQESAADLVRRFQIRAASLEQPIATLSGGNQQKALIARSVQTNPRVLVIASPTRGVDIGAKEAIHALILELAARGNALILISPELDELLGLAHRIAVFSDGRMTGILTRAEATPTRIMQLAIRREAARVA